MLLKVRVVSDKLARGFKQPRPKILRGHTERISTGCGNMYVQLCSKDGELFEVFASLGKSGGCATCNTEALTRSITMGLRCGVDPNEYVRQLRHIACPRPIVGGGQEVVSCPDGIAQAIESELVVLAEGGS